MKFGSFCDPIRLHAEMLQQNYWPALLLRGEAVGPWRLFAGVHTILHFSRFPRLSSTRVCEENISWVWQKHTWQTTIRVPRSLFQSLMSSFAKEMASSSVQCFLMLFTDIPILVSWNPQKSRLMITNQNIAAPFLLNSPGEASVSFWCSSAPSEGPEHRPACAHAGLLGGDWFVVLTHVITV